MSDDVIIAFDDANYGFRFNLMVARDRRFGKKINYK